MVDSKVTKLRNEYEQKSVIGQFLEGAPQEVKGLLEELASSPNATGISVRVITERFPGDPRLDYFSDY